jgi:hypothetical protein
VVFRASHTDVLNLHAVRDALGRARAGQRVASTPSLKMPRAGPLALATG